MLLSVLTDVLSMRLTVRTQVLIAKHSHLTKKGKEEIRQEFPLVHVSLFPRSYLNGGPICRFGIKTLSVALKPIRVFVLCVHCVFLSLPVYVSGCKQLSVKQRLQPWR